MYLKQLLLALIFVSAFSNYAIGDERAERRQLADEAASAFRASEFEKLEELADLYRSSKARTESGTWKLVWFHRGIVGTTRELDKMDDHGWSEFFSKVESWAEMYPNSPNPVIAHAAALERRGWMFRGTRYASKVDPKDMQTFHDYAVKAGNHLIENREKGSKDPFWYVRMAWFSKALGVEKSDFLAFIDEGIETYPDFDEIYFITANFLNPRWHGSKEDIAEFAGKNRARTYSDRGNELYARIYWAAGRDQSGRYIFQDPPANWGLILKGMDEIIAKYPSQWNINKFAFFACYKPDARAAKKYMKLIKRPIDIDAWITQESFDNCEKYLAQFPD